MRILDVNVNKKMVRGGGFFIVSVSGAKDAKPYEKCSQSVDISGS